MNINGWKSISMSVAAALSVEGAVNNLGIVHYCMSRCGQPHAFGYDFFLNEGISK